MTAEFDIAAPLPTGTLLLEASAGTGKTWTIAALVVRYVAEGSATLDQLLVVTFTRAASQELRERVRERLVEAAGTLADPASYSGGDALLDLLLDVDDSERRLRLTRVRTALTGFDEAAIVTIHQFCQMVLKGLGVAGDTDQGAQLVEDLDGLLVEVVDDLYLRDHLTAADATTFPRAAALKVARAAVADPRSTLVPGDPEVGSLAAKRVAFAEKVRHEIDVRKRRLGVLSYDDLLGQLADALADEGSPARARMQERWRVVLVDEFQDTDPVQWEVFDRAFSGASTMVLIGDPKQAIYAFRGGDVFTYLQARASATGTATLAVNRRSDAGLLDSLQVVLEGAELGPGIFVLPVSASHQEPRLTGGGPPFSLRVLTRADLGLDSRHVGRVGDVRPRIAADVASQVRALLDPGVRFEGRGLTAWDIAVLANTRPQLEVVRQALLAQGIPAVISGGGSVFATTAASEWLTLLQAMQQPGSGARVRAAGLTSFFGLSIDDLASGGDGVTESLSETIRDWLQLFTERGVAAVFETAVAQGLVQRVLSRVGGERDLTDLRHLAESLHRVGTREHLGLPALVAWTQVQLSQDVNETATERTRRLDSDARAVQLNTIHGSKGLEFPVVLVPFLADRHVRDVRRDELTFHDPAGERLLDIGGAAGRARAVDQQVRAEDDGESLRLLYVATTRAKSRLIAWWSPSTNTPAGPLNRLLLGRKPGEGPCRRAVDPPDDASALSWFRAWEARGGPALERAVSEPTPPLTSVPTAARLGVRRFSRVIDTDWRRTSYSSLSAPADRESVVGGPGDDAVAGVTSEPELVPRDDEELHATVIAVPELADDPRSPMADLPVGAAFGSLVHGVLEHADLSVAQSAGELEAEFLARIDEQLGWWPQELDREGLARALVAVCDTPLGPLAHNTTLGRVGAADRLCELDFELPLAGGDQRGLVDPNRLGELASLLRRHLPEGDPVRAYAAVLDADPALGRQLLVGYLTGSVDVVLRVGGQFLIADYKTNWLGPREAELSAAAYSPSALAAAMGHSDYPLQALLYAVVLHRFLRWRVPGYDPETHFGGVLYLYLRGMCGPQTPVIDAHPCGVFSWRPPIALVTELSDLLDGATKRQVTR